jgi:hypothetical protein
VVRAVIGEACAVHVDVGGVVWRAVRCDRVAVEAGLAAAVDDAWLGVGEGQAAEVVWDVVLVVGVWAVGRRLGHGASLVGNEGVLVVLVVVVVDELVWLACRVGLRRRSGEDVRLVARALGDALVERARRLRSLAKMRELVGVDGMRYDAGVVAVAHVVTRVLRDGRVEARDALSVVERVVGEVCETDGMRLFWRKCRVSRGARLVDVASYHVRCVMS